MATAPMRIPELPDLRAMRDDELTLGALAGVLKRRRTIFLYVVGGFLMMVTLYCMLTTRRYQATGEIQIQKDSAGAFGLESSVMGDAGYGFAAFWQGMRGESYNVIVALRFVIFHAHNGFLEIWLELGAVGLLLFALSYIRAWRKLCPLLWSKGISSAFWMVFVLLLVALYDIDENTLFAFNGLFWILYVAVLADIEILAIEHRPAPLSWNRHSSEITHVPASAAS